MLGDFCGGDFLDRLESGFRLAGIKAFDREKFVSSREKKDVGGKRRLSETGMIQLGEYPSKTRPEKSQKPLGS